MAIIFKRRRSNETLSGSVFELHLDLIFEILIRLPVKPLLRFKSVCKTWYKLIENPDFMNKQHTLSKLKNKLIENPDFMISTHRSSLLTITLDLKSRAYTMCLRSTVKAHNPNPNPNPKVILYDDYPSVLGIHDGLVWAASMNSESIICNPTIGHVRKIPPFSLAKICTRTSVAFYGIGFEDNECKLFTIVHSKYPSEFAVRAEMYSMSTDLWRLIDVKIGEIDACLYGYYCGMKAVVINDVFYWGAYDNCLWHTVASFHMNTYIFGVLKGPERLGWTSGRLIDLKGELAWLNRLDASSFNLWMLNQKERSWTMKLRVEGLTVERLPGFCYYLECLGCESNGNLVMQYYSSDSEFKLFTYNLESHAIMYLPQGHYTERKILGRVVCLYTESLLSVGQKKREVK